MIALAVLVVAGCTIDPPPVPKSAKVPPPAQPTELQAWSRDLNLETDPDRIARGQLTEGLVASNSGMSYDQQRLDYRSAFEEERKQTPAEQTLQRARERAAAAGLPPSGEKVDAEPLPPEGAVESGEVVSPKPRRDSRLPPPPKFPPLPAKQQATQAPLEPVSAKRARTGAGSTTEVQMASVAAEARGTSNGTVLVQVAAVRDERKVAAEWRRLQNRYPQILKPLQLTVEKVHLGERGVFYRVQASAFENKAVATEACHSLINLGQDCFVVVR